MESSEQLEIMKVKKFIEDLFTTVSKENFENIKKYLENLIATQPLLDLKKKDRLTYPSLINDIKEGKGKNILHFAASKGDLTLFAYLLEKGDEEGNNPLFIAIQHKSEKIIHYIFENLPNFNEYINYRRKSGINVFDLVCMEGDTKLCEFLISKGVDVNISSVSPDIASPLQWATVSSHTEIIKILLKNDAKIQTNTISLLPPPIFLAIGNNQLEIIKLLVEKNEDCVNDKNSGWSTLFLAAEIGNQDILEYLISKNVDLYYEFEGKTAIDIALENDNLKLVEILFEKSKGTLKAKPIEKKEEIPIKNVKIPTEEEKEEAEKIKLSANKLFMENKYEDAKQMYSKAIDLNPTNHIFFTNKAACNIKIKQFEEAIKDCKEALKINDQWAKAHFRLGEAYLGLLNYEEAAVSFFDGLKIEPKNNSFKEGLQKAIQEGKKFHAANKKN